MKESAGILGEKNMRMIDYVMWHVTVLFQQLF
jgi:hypothetical protein